MAIARITFKQLHAACNIYKEKKTEKLWESTTELQHTNEFKEITMLLPNKRDDSFSLHFTVNTGSFFGFRTKQDEWNNCMIRMLSNGCRNIVTSVEDTECIPKTIEELRQKLIENENLPKEQKTCYLHELKDIHLDDGAPWRLNALNDNVKHEYTKVIEYLEQFVAENQVTPG